MKKILIVFALLVCCGLNFTSAFASSTWNVQCVNKTSTNLDIQLQSCDPDIFFNLPPNSTVTKSISNNCGGVLLYFMEVGQSGWHRETSQAQHHHKRWTYKTCTPVPITCSYGVTTEWSNY